MGSIGLPADVATKVEELGFDAASEVAEVVLNHLHTAVEVVEDVSEDLFGCWLINRHGAFPVKW